jgi:outer membrane protein OmpA-like peptidoglycan-associated protein
MFCESAKKLEEGDVNGARKRSNDATEQLRVAELAAIKANYLNEAWELMEEAKRKDVKDRAPKTILNAELLIKNAEKELNENRYDTDVARSLAQEAVYEVKHALYLSSIIKEMRNKKYSFEDLMLAAELPIQKIANELDVVATFDTGFDKTTSKIIARVEEYQDKNNQLNRNVIDTEQKSALLEERVAELEKKLGGIEQEKSTLAGRIKIQQRIQEKFNTVDNLFSREEAIILRDASNVILRMVGLNFNVGSSVIRPHYYSLLTKVQQSISLFPGCLVIIEGHTDSHGGDAANLKLSNRRAQAVRQYIIANMGIEESRVESIGYGESKPIASNETKSGRLKNRRIDLIIRPQVEGTN